MRSYLARSPMGMADVRIAPALWPTASWTLLSVAGEYALGLISAVAVAQPIIGRAVFWGSS